MDGGGKWLIISVLLNHHQKPMKGVRKWKRKTGLTKLVNMDGFTSFSKATLAQALNLNNVVIVGREYQLHCSFVGDDCVHVIIAVAPVHYL